MNRESRTLKRMAVAGLALALCLPATSHAVWQWMRGAAATDFKEADWAMLKETAMHVLNELPDHEQANWSNPDTGNKGSVMALATFQYHGQKCRRAALRNITYRGRDDRAAYTLCQQADGDWLFVPESAIREATASEQAGSGDTAAEDAAAETGGSGQPEAAATDSGS